MFLNIISLVCLINITAALRGLAGLGGFVQEVYRWKQLAYETTPSDFNPYNNVPMGIDRYQEKLFITIPRRNPGIPSSLTYIDLNSVRESPLLKPFPDFTTNTLHTPLHDDPNKIISVYRTRIDDCNRLWFVDTGILEYPKNNKTQVQPPSIWVMNPESGEKIRRFEFPIEQNGIGMASITVDVDVKSCDDAFAYIPDLYFNKMYVYSFRKNQVWTFVHDSFKMDPLHVDLKVAGHKFQWDDGIFSITMGPRNVDGFRDIYFHPMISTKEFVVSSKVLQSEENANRVDHGSDFRLLGNRGDATQSSMHELDLGTGVIFFAEIGRNAIGCMNSANPINSQNHGTIKQDNDRMIYPSDLKVDSEGDIWVMTNTLPLFIYSQLNKEEYNFRIWRTNARETIRGTVCDLVEPQDLELQRIFPNLMALE